MSIVKRDFTMAPYQVADETFVIPWALAAPPVGLFPMNSLVIRGKEPVLVDTGSPADREGWLNNVSSVVDLDDVRWIFLSHDDRDHSGNLMAALEACPNATVLTTWYSVGRMADEWDTPLDRCRFMNDGDVLDIGDRRIVAIRPPVFDNPTTRALFDERTGVFWSADTFATNVREPLCDSADLTQDAFRDGQLLGGRLMAAWHPWLDEGKFCAHVQKVQDLPIKVIAGGHTPAIRGPRIEEAFGLVRQLPAIKPWPEYTQRTLEKWMAAIASLSSARSLSRCASIPLSGQDLARRAFEGVMRYAERVGLRFTVLSDGFAACNDPAALEAICDRLGIEVTSTMSSSLIGISSMAVAGSYGLARS